MAGRSRRAVFDEDAELYDRARHGYPAELLVELERLAHVGRGSRLLEIGPGTGQATRALAALGADVTAVELGAALGAVLERNLPAVDVVVADFDTWAVPEGQFDAVVAFTSWHWLDPGTRTAKAARGLRQGGALATVTTFHVAGGTESFFAEAQRCYERWDPETPAGGIALQRSEDVSPAFDEVDESPLFEPAERRRFQADVAYRTGQYVDLLRTFSGHRAMPVSGQRGLVDCIATLIDEGYAGRVTKRYLYELRVARRR